MESDILLICDRKKIDNNGCHGAPDWMIEVVSPSSKSMDYYRKTCAYSEAGVCEYWIVDPMKETVIIYDYEHEEAPKPYHFTDKIEVRFLAGLTPDFGELKERLDNLF